MGLKGSPSSLSCLWSSSIPPTSKWTLLDPPPDSSWCSWVNAQICMDSPPVSSLDPIKKSQHFYWEGRFTSLYSIVLISIQVLHTLILNYYLNVPSLFSFRLQNVCINNIDTVAHMIKIHGDHKFHFTSILIKFQLTSFILLFYFTHENLSFW